MVLSLKKTRSFRRKSTTCRRLYIYKNSNQQFTWRTCIYKKTENLGGGSKEIHSFPDFFIQNGKNRQNFHFEIGKVIQNRKKGQNFYFEIRV